MYPSRKEMDPIDSGTSVFYQAIPAVGADGKNIMKLIPVKMVNGQFFRSQISQPKMDPTPQKAVIEIVKKAALNPPDTQQIVRNQVSLMKAFPNQVGLDLGNSLNKHRLQRENVNLMAIVPPMTKPAANSVTAGRLPSQLPVTVKSPALPRGQYLQIPPNAQVRTVPAPELPPVIKKQIFTSSANSTSSGVPSVVNVSPITTVNQGVTPQSECALHSIKLLCNTLNITSCGPPSKESKPHLKLIPKVSQRPNSPIKWVIEEEDSSTAPTVDPINPSVSSEILRVVAERENASKHFDVLTKPVSWSNQGKSGHGQTNTVVMCNGKVFLVAENGNPQYKMGKNDSPTAARKSYEFNKTIVPSSQPSLESVAPQKRQGLTNIIPDESNEVIDLCDDDAAHNYSQQAASVHMSAGSHPDEDNVIFVSYIPPKSECESTQDLRLKTQMTLVKETDQMSISTSNNVMDQKSLDGTTGGPGRRIPGQNMSVSTVKNLTHVCGSAVMNMHNNVGSNISSQQSTSTQQLESMAVDGGTKSPADPINIAPVPVWIVKNAALNPSATQQILKKKVSLMKAFPNQVGLDQSSSLNKHPLQQQNVNLSIVTPMATPAANSGKSGRLPGQLPVTVKSPVIKKQIFTSSANSTSSGVPSVVNVSPITTVNQGVTPQSECALHSIKLLCKTSNITSCGPPSKESKPHLKLIPKVSQRPNSPMKWVIEEEDSSTAPTVDPINLSVSSEILRIVAERENASKHFDVLTKPVSWSEQKSLDGTSDALGRRIPGHNMSVKNLKHVCGSTVLNMYNNVGSNISSQQSTSIQQLESMEVDPCPADPSTSDSSGICSRIEKDIYKMESSVIPVTSRPSSLASESCQVSDDLLRRMFGITVSVKICLHRIDGASVGSIRSAEDHQKLRSRVKEEERFLQGLHSPHSDIGPRKCSRFKLNTKPLSVLKNKYHSGNTSHKGTSCDVETEPMIGYVEPIDEDFFSTDENDIPNSQGTASRPQTHVDLNATTRRMGRTRKRTMCPCCIPGTPDRAVKSSRAKSEVPEKGAWTTKQKSKKGERRKAVRKEVKTSGRMNGLTGKNKRSCKTSEVPASDSLSTTSMDCDELKQREQIKRLKELLKEKEEALELIRNSTS